MTTKNTLQASQSGKQQIEQAIQRKAWKISENDPRPLQAASKFLIAEYARTNNLDAGDRALRAGGANRRLWSRDLEQIFRFKPKTSKEKINKIKVDLIKSQSQSCLEFIEQLIDVEEIYPAGISYGTWMRFASATSTESINQKSFKAYCQILDLDWQQIRQTETTPNLSSPSTINNCLHNLTAPDSLHVGRKSQLQQLQQWLEDQRTYRISIEGIGGAGKTSLALQAAYYCLQTSLFEAIVFTSAKPQRLKSTIIPCLGQQRTLGDMFTAIANTFENSDLLEGEFKQQLQQVQNWLRSRKTLLVIDNLETVAEVESILAFVYELPLSVKVIVTSRQRILDDFQTIVLSGLPETEAIELIDYHSRQKKLGLKAKQSKILYQKTGGIPAAIVYAIGQLAAGYELEYIIPRMTLADADFSRFYFATAIKRLTQLSHQLLISLALFPVGATKAAIVAVATTDTAIVEPELVQLQQLNLIFLQQQRYDMLPLTRGYVESELQANPEFELQVRHRWVGYYIDYLASQPSQAYTDWHNSYIDSEWENIREAVQWCYEHQEYEYFVKFWTFIKHYTHLRGYWQERLIWMNWLSKTAYQRQDWQTATEALCDYAKTLILLDQSSKNEAVERLNHAWNLSQTYCDLVMTGNIGIETALFYIQQFNFEQAEVWLDKVEEISIKSPEKSKNAGIKAKISYYRAAMLEKKGDRPLAKTYYQQALTQAKAINWQRGIVYNQLCLAVIDIQQRQNLTAAEQSLKKNMSIVEQNQDKRCLAFCRRAFALLEGVKGNQQQSIQWATLAREDFSRLGMRQQALEMKRWSKNPSAANDVNI